MQRPSCETITATTTTTTTTTTRKKKKINARQDAHGNTTDEDDDDENETTKRRRRRRRRRRRKRFNRASLFLLLLFGLYNYYCSIAIEALASSGSTTTTTTTNKYSTRLVHTRYGTLRGIVARSSSSSSSTTYEQASTVELYLGIPYASPPLGALRFMPPVTPSPWRGTRLADTLPRACPQKQQIDEHGANNLPEARRYYLTRLSGLLANQSEDCLYLNLYVPRPPGGTGQQGSVAAAAVSAAPHHAGAPSPDQLPALLLIHGDSYSWGAGNLLDGTALAAYGRIIVVSINFRLGIFGFLKTSSKDSAQGNYGLMDLVAGVHWLRENLPSFGGDPKRITLMGQGTGAALANFLAVSPMSKELIERAVLLSGSALSPWALQREPLQVKRRVAEQIGCQGDNENDDIASCLRLRSVKELLDVKLDVPRFTSGYAPFGDGAIVPIGPIGVNQPTATSAGLMPLMPGPGSEFANFGDHDVLMGLTSDEAWLELTEQDLQYGMNETRRDRILRTYVRNTYRYHLHEIYSTLRNEYTDWERGEPNPLSISDGLLSLLADGQITAPLLRLALLHSVNGGRGYLLHYQRNDDVDNNRRTEVMPYLLGLPLLRNDHHYHAISGAFGHRRSFNYSAADENLSRLLVHYLSNFVRRGDPNGAAMSSMSSVAWAATAELDVSSPPFWDSYDSINQLYLEAGPNPEMRSHYRGHKMSLWLNLLPQLHRPGYELSMRHHHLAESPNLYEGSVRPQTMAMPIPAPPLPLPFPTEPSMIHTSSSGSASFSTTVADATAATDCTTNNLSSLLPEPATTAPSNLDLKPGPDNVLQKIASKHYQSHTTALTVTIAVGIFLLLLNILIFARIYHQRDKNGSPDPRTSGLAGLADKKKEELLEIACTGGVLRDSTPPSLSTTKLGPNKRTLTSYVMEHHRHHLHHQRQHNRTANDSNSDESGTDDNNGQANGNNNVSSSSNNNSPVLQMASQPRKGKYVQELELGLHQLQDYEQHGGSSSSYFCPSPQRTPSPCVDATMAATVGDLDEIDLPEPPPPPKSPAPASSMSIVCPGILRQPGTPGSAKKRVQIQEISV